MTETTRKSYPRKDKQPRPHPYPMVLTYNMDFETQGDKQDGTALLGTMQINGALFHVNALKVVDDGPDGSGVQQLAEGDARAYPEMLDVYSEAMQTVEIEGYEGDYILVIHPYGR